MGNTRCTFDCTTGKDINSLCSLDGTWEPYPTCNGDLRETRDGCDGCPGPVGAARNRTAEAIQNRNTASDRRVPKIISNNGERKTVPSFAGNINIGVIDQNQKNRFNSQQRPGPAARPTTSSPPRNFNNLQNQNFRQQQQTRPQQLPQQQPQRQPQQQFQQQQPQRQPQQQFQQQQPQRQFQQQPQRQPQSTAPNKQLSLFEQIKQRINREKQLKNQIIEKQIEKERQEQRQQQQPQPQQNFRQPQPQQNFRQSLGSFGVFEAVDLSGPSASPLPPPTPARNLGSRQAQNEGFFGVFPEVNLQ